MVHTPPALPFLIDDILAKRHHDPDQCPVENCNGEFDYLVKLRRVSSYHWRPDHVVSAREPAVLQFEQGLVDKAAANRRATQFLAGQFHENIIMFETVHNCELFEACGRLGSLPCKELNDFLLQSASDEVVFKSRDLCDLHLIPGMEEMYSRRVVVGRPAAKKARLLELGISIPPRGRLARPVIREEDGRVCYFWVPFNNDRVREERGDVIPPTVPAAAAAAAATTESSSEAGSPDRDAGKIGESTTSDSDTGHDYEDLEYEAHPSYYTIS